MRSNWPGWIAAGIVLLAVGMTVATSCETEKTYTLAPGGTDTVWVIVLEDTVFAVDQSFLDCVNECIQEPPNGNPLNLCVRACMEIE